MNLGILIVADLAGESVMANERSLYGRSGPQFPALDVRFARVYLAGTAGPAPVPQKSGHEGAVSNAVTIA